ncbi:hypothetical protein LEP1GSC172_3496 [Leptospira noguchii]|uniref:Uncharacterized protein n=2 Tax=Leptospira noguchii TaxID=28182 RepID=T0FPH3_9LEPT|nr:hypothetical protein LEP1GSC172_3496 [Leptospira noguchii]EQA71470.1 hypothetical protein LEP1GSC059_2809 [Leptospira noguchii serovar Panama str. CZ214]
MIFFHGHSPNPKIRFDNLKRYTRFRFFLRKRNQAHARTSAQKIL